MSGLFSFEDGPYDPQTELFCTDPFSFTECEQEDFSFRPGASSFFQSQLSWGDILRDGQTPVPQPTFPVARHGRRAPTQPLKKWDKKEKEQRWITCDECDYVTTFERRGDLTKHKRVHTGEKPYKCDLCDYATTMSCNLTNHQRRHTRKLKFKCSSCKFSTPTKSVLVRHQGIHATKREKPFRCHLCSYAATQKGYLVYHLRTHTEEKQFKCDSCSYACKQASALGVHKRCHSGEKQAFQCDFCSYSCAKQGSVTRHLQRQHPAAMRPNLDPNKRHRCTFESCDFASDRRTYLLSHLLTHSEKKAQASTNKRKRAKATVETTATETMATVETTAADALVETTSQQRTKKRGTLTRHLHRQHPAANKRHRCTFESCDSAFARRCYLLSHLLTHSEKQTQASPDIEAMEEVTAAEVVVETMATVEPTAIDAALVETTSSQQITRISADLRSSARSGGGSLALSKCAYCDFAAPRALDVLVHKLRAHAHLFLANSAAHDET